MGSASPPEGYVEILNGKDRIILQQALRPRLESLGVADLDSLREQAVEGSHLGRSRHFTVDLGDGSRAVVKESRRGGMMRWLFGDLYYGDGRFLREIQVTTEAERKGLRVAPIVASVSRAARLGFCRHHYLVRELVGAVDLRRYLDRSSRKGGEDAREKRRVLRSVAEGVRALHDAGICHADLNLGNILVLPSRGGGAGEIGFIDFDTSRMGSDAPAADRLGNLLRLYRSFLKSPLPGETVTRTDLARFTLAYHGGDRAASRGAWRTFRRSRLRLAAHRALWRLGLR